MRPWHGSLFFATAVLVQLQIPPSRSNVCCGPGPDPRDCRCQMLHDTDEIACYYSELDGSEPKAKTPQLTGYSQGGTFASGVGVTLFCNVSYLSSPTKCPLKVVWEHNGTAVDPSLVHVNNTFKNNIYKSTLSIPHFSASAQGDYVCRVEHKTDSGSTASPLAILQLPKFLGWIDRGYSPPTDANTVTLTVQKGGSVILECSPNTTESLKGRIPQLGAKIATLPLPSGNVLVPDVQEDVSISCVWSLQEAHTRHFHISVSPDPPPEDLRLVVRPMDSVVAAGFSLELYCIAEGPSPASITWYKDDVPVDGQMGKGEVLEVNEPTSSDGGTYTCSVSDGSLTLNASAVVTVVDPPGPVSLSVDGDTSALNIDLETGIVTVSQSVDSSLRLSCRGNTTTGLHYKWLHGGMLTAEGEGVESLVLATSDLHNLTGSYQCIVSNIAGRRLSQALWITIDESKPHPPVDVRIKKNTWPGVYFEYDIVWERPEEGSVTNYTVETLSLSDGRAANYCSCIGHHSDATNTFFAFWAGCFPDVIRDYSLYYRVAANTKDSQSDFITGPSTTVTLDAPPKAKSLSVETVPATNKWDLSLSWEYQDTENYYPVCYHTTVTPPCGTASTRISSSPVQASMNCCTACEWSVTNINHAYPTRNSVNRSNYSTHPLKPWAPPQLLSVERLGTSGTSFSVSFELPDRSKSCMCEVGENFQVTVGTNDTSITPVTTTISLTDSAFNVNIPGADCSAVYDISLAFNNSVGMSPYSSPFTVVLPTGNNIPRFSKALQYDNTSESEVTVSYQLEPGAECLLGDGLLHSDICYAATQSSDICSPDLFNTLDHVNCTSIISESGNLSLPRYQTFCVVAKVWSDLLDMNVSTRTLTLPANEGIPSEKPKNLLASPVSTALNISWSAPPEESWHGIPYGYSLNISTAGGELVYSREAVLSNSLMYKNYNSSLAYNVTISACTRVGCGPITSTIISHDDQLTTDQPSNGSDQVTTDQPSNGSDNIQPVIDHSSNDRGSVTLAVIVTSSTLSVLVISALIMIIFISCTCYHRRRKKYARLRNGSTPETALLEDNESLVASRGPPTGAPARSEYTDFESLCSGNSRVGDSRVGEWVKQTTSQHRDGYVRDADEELALQQEQDTTQPSGPSLVPPPDTQSSNGYCSESGGSLQVARNSGGSATTATTPLSSGYSTEHHTTPVVVASISEQSCSGQLQPAYTGIHNLIAQPLPPECTFNNNNHPNTRNSLHQTISDFMDANDDFISSLLCQEDFDPPSSNPAVDLNNKNVPDSSSPYTPSDNLSSIIQMTTPNRHPVKSGERQEEETDSVFDTSMSPVRHSATQGPPGRTRSSMTSGFLSLSDTSLDSSDNMEMTPIRTCPNPPPLASGHSSTTSWATWTPPSKQPAPVIPSLLSSEVNKTAASLLPSPPIDHMQLSCYENIDGDPLAHEAFRFEL